MGTPQAKRLKGDIRKKFSIGTNKEIILETNKIRKNDTIVTAKIGVFYTESYPEADYFDRRFKTLETIKVLADNKSGKLKRVI